MRGSFRRPSAAKLEAEPARVTIRVYRALARPGTWLSRGTKTFFCSPAWVGRCGASACGRLCRDLARPRQRQQPHPGRAQFGASRRRVSAAAVGPDPGRRRRILWTCPVADRPVGPLTARRTREPAREFVDGPAGPLQSGANGRRLD